MCLLGSLNLMCTKFIVNTEKVSLKVGTCLSKVTLAIIKAEKDQSKVTRLIGLRLDLISLWLSSIM